MSELNERAVPEQDDPKRVGEAIFRAGASFDAFTSQMRRAFDLNAHERLALSALWSRGAMTMTELGTWIPLSRAAVTTLVDRLEDAGLVRRGNDELDRRRKVVEITDLAIQRMVPVITPFGDALQELVASRAPQEWQAIAAFIEDFRSLCEAHATRLTQLSDDEIQRLAAVTASA